MITLKLDEEYIVELYEILCDIPFEKSYTLFHDEPGYKRYAGVEQLIEQLYNYCKED